MRSLLLVALLSLGAHRCVSNASAAVLKAPPIKSKTADVRKKQAVVSKSLYAKLKAQALNEARAEVAREQDALEKAKLDALLELDASATDTGEPRPADGGEE